jgi:hypothetical protein
LLEGELKAFTGGEEMSPGQWVEILKASIWNAPEVTFRVFDVMRVFPPKVSVKPIGGPKRALIALLRLNKNMSKEKAETSLRDQGYQFTPNAFKTEIWPSAWSDLEKEGMKKPGAGRKPKSAT